MSLTTETKNWMVDYGLYCNRKYRSDMEQIFAFVDEAGKKLNRQIKDLDDIRIAMASLKEIREQQISTDFLLGPVEVNTALFTQKHTRRGPVVLSSAHWNVSLEESCSKSSMEVERKCANAYMFYVNV